MNHEEFSDIVNAQVEICSKLLTMKGHEYATEDRLHNFNVAAALQGVTPKEALAGMMVKHTVSIYDMCGSPTEYTLDLWDEKISDHINYLLILAAVVRNEKKGLDTVSSE